MYLLLILKTITFFNICSSSYDYTCPIALNWLIRGKILCDRTKKYSCLRDENTESFREICRKTPSLLAKGYKYVIRGSLDGEQCNEYRYQPFIFKTNQSSDCALQKSNCNEEGQIIYSSGSTTEDITCRCDYSKRYAPIKKSRNPCFCMPLVEDCSCHLKLCPEKTHLSSEYICKSDYTLVKLDNCGQIKLTISGNTIVRTMLTESFKVAKIDASWLVPIITVVAGLLLILGFLLVILSGRLDSSVNQKEKLPEGLLEMKECKREYLDTTEKRIMLIGKKDVGKTATRKSIMNIGERVCVNFRDEEGEKTIEYTKIKETVFCMAVTSELSNENMSSMNFENKLRTCIEQTSPGLHAILLVINATDGYKKEDYDTFNGFLSYFSPKILEFGVVVFTHGEQIQQNGKNYIQDILKVPSKLRELLYLFDGRTLLIDNLDEKQSKVQAESLIEMIETINSEHSVYYKNDYFLEVEHALLETEFIQQKAYLEKKDNTLKDCKNEKIRILNRVKMPNCLHEVVKLKEPTISAATYLPDPTNHEFYACDDIQRAKQQIS